MSERQEVFDMDNYLPCSCDDGIMELDLFYAPFALASFRVFSVHREGVKEIIREFGITTSARRKTMRTDIT